MIDIIDAFVPASPSPSGNQLSFIARDFTRNGSYAVVADASQIPVRTVAIGNSDTGTGAKVVVTGNGNGSPFAVVRSEGTFDNVVDSLELFDPDIDGLPTLVPRRVLETGITIGEVGNPGNLLPLARINTANRVFDNDIGLTVSGANGRFLAVVDTATEVVLARQTFDSENGNTAVLTTTNTNYALSVDGRLVGELEFRGPSFPTPLLAYGVVTCNVDLSNCTVVRLLDDLGQPLQVFLPFQTQPDISNNTVILQATVDGFDVDTYIADISTATVGDLMATRTELTGTGPGEPSTDGRNFYFTTAWNNGATSIGDLTVTGSDLNYIGGGVIPNRSLGVKIVDVTPPSNEPPQLDPIADVIIAPFQSRVINIRAIDPEGDPIRLSAQGLPDYCTLIDNGDGTGTIECILNGFVIEKSHLITVVATDDSNASSQQTFTLEIDDPTATMTLIPDQTVEEGSVLTVGLGANDVNPAESITFSSSGMPGFGILTDFGDWTGQLLFSPLSGDANLYLITVFATDSHDNVDSQTFTLTVTAPPPPPNQAPTADFTYSSCFKLNCGFTNASSDDKGIINLSFNWDFGDSSSGSTLINPSHLFPAEGIYNVTLTAFDVEGEMDQITKEVTVGSVDYAVKSLRNVRKSLSLARLKPFTPVVDVQNVGVLEGSVSVDITIREGIDIFYSENRVVTDPVGGKSLTIKDLPEFDPNVVPSLLPGDQLSVEVLIHDQHEGNNLLEKIITFK